MKKLAVLLLFMAFTGVYLQASPLHVAVRSLDIKMFNRLIAEKENQALINEVDDGGLTPLHYACSLGVVEMTAALLENGANPNQTSENGKNALHHAVSIDALCFAPQEANPDFTLCPLTIPAMLASAGVDVNQSDNEGNTALHIAAKNGLVGVVATIIQAGGNVNCLNGSGETPLHLVGGPMPHICAQVLLLNKADTALKNKSGLTPMDLAMQKKNQLLINMIKRYAP